MKKRYDFSERNITSKLSWFNPRQALTIDSKRPVMIVNLIEELPCIVPSKDVDLIQNIDDQWRKLPFATFPAVWLNEPIDKFWLKIREKMDISREKEFYNIGQFVLDLLVLPHSSASCERVFSKVNLIKTKMRNKLITKTLNGLILSSQHIAENGGDHFHPTKNMLDLMTTSNLYLHLRRNTEEQNEDKHRSRE